MDEESIFLRETKVIDEAESLLGTKNSAGNPLARPYSDLLTEYKKLFRQTQRLVKMSDRMQKNLNELNAELQSHKEILSKMSYIDGLTSIANRRCFNERLETEWNRALRTSRPLALILLDLDYFKQFNDHYGHAEGDACLIQVAGALGRAVKRPGDLAARYGGEEFVILLPETTSTGAITVASDVQSRIGELAIAHQCSDIAPVVTVSIGVAVMFPEKIDRHQDLIEAADRQLYAAKKAGRNQIKEKVVGNDASD